MPVGAGIERQIHVGHAARKLADHLVGAKLPGPKHKKRSYTIGNLIVHIDAPRPTVSANAAPKPAPFPAQTRKPGTRPATSAPARPYLERPALRPQDPPQ